MKKGNNKKKNKNEQLWSKIRDNINSDNLDEKYLKIKFNSDNDFLLKTLELNSMIMVVRTAFNKDNKYYPQIFLSLMFA